MSDHELTDHDVHGLFRTLREQVVTVVHDFTDRVVERADDAAEDQRGQAPDPTSVLGGLLVQLANLLTGTPSGDPDDAA